MPDKQENISSKVASDIAVIKNQILNLSEQFKGYREESDRCTEKLTTRITVIELDNVATKQKVSNMTIFQSVFSVVVGGVATFLGSTSK